MYALHCEGFAEKEGFRTGSLEWDIKMLEIDAMQVKYDFDSGVKELFYGLAQCGEVKTVIAERAAEVLRILEERGYIVVIGQRGI